MRRVVIRKILTVVLFLGCDLREARLHVRVRRVIGISPECLHFYFNL